MAMSVSPSCIAETVSRPKVENVVNPPRNPVIRRGVTQRGVFWAKCPKTHPIKKHPSRLQARTPSGN